MGNDKKKKKGERYIVKTGINPNAGAKKTKEEGLSEKELAAKMIKMGLKKQSQPSDKKATFVKGSGKVKAGPSGIVTSSAYELKNPKPKIEKTTTRIPEDYQGPGSKRIRDQFTVGKDKFVGNKSSTYKSNQGDKRADFGATTNVGGINQPHTKSAPKTKTTTAKGSMVRGNTKTSKDDYTPQEWSELTRKQKKARRKLKRRS